MLANGNHAGIGTMHVVLRHLRVVLGKSQRKDQVRYGSQVRTLARALLFFCYMRPASNYRAYR